jgi:hypothetical protein
VASWDAASAAAEDGAAGGAADAQAPPGASSGALAPYVALSLRTAGAGGAAATHHLKLTLLEFRVRHPHIQALHSRRARWVLSACGCVGAQELAKAVKDMTRAMNTMQ